ncbi:MAG: 5-(carboxyamino)imidazole ribonucleotide synthase [Methylococcales bacterium]|jgi:5-(carboxyamino)imidazole ribonucleotide synthase|nr:5-(carboxyamino)imidazole ribonucleotide synthase [Methylococcales bacterium]MBT3815666.1 5-(carboxyamino)imidazole ribonucleotide synthase [Methylococcales bacterium]MBT4348361.1 5-(carboxyamino)imidazole ribonucleotide synthase [Methylococcales bacterium]MBT4663937.1 5-(carboxyamino)imidazole ribonucleotide synthase [Methylococcales bacterium]MBT4765981.1 5-(carboxyamino)imidazole ribonucleotide synthase [Methylococcales bacterium]
MKIGILGGGQLARMLALAGYPLGLDFAIIDPSNDAGAIGLANHLHGAYDDESLLHELAQQTDIVTYEFENVPASVAQLLAQHTQIAPCARALAIAQDRLIEKKFFHDLNIPTTNFAAVNSLDDLEQAIKTIGFSAILKSCRMGYDGKGQVLLHGPEDLVSAWNSMRNSPSIVEGFVPHTREISIIAARRPNGETVFYPLSENSHSQGILRVSRCCIDDPKQHEAEQYLARIMEELDYVGTIALELFEVQGQLLANEFAPRVHNSGHWTIEGAETSQFENHLRAILDWPLGSTQAKGYSGMVNFIGGLPPTEQVLAIKNTHQHLYAKQPRPGRKVGHATIRTDDPELFESSLKKLTQLAEQNIA